MPAVTAKVTVSPTAGLALASSSRTVKGALWLLIITSWLSPETRAMVGPVTGVKDVAPAD